MKKTITDQQKELATIAVLLSKTMKKYMNEKKDRTTMDSVASSFYDTLDDYIKETKIKLETELSDDQWRAILSDIQKIING